MFWIVSFADFLVDRLRLAFFFITRDVNVDVLTILSLIDYSSVYYVALYFTIILFSLVSLLYNAVITDNWGIVRSFIGLEPLSNVTQIQRGWLLLTIIVLTTAYGFRLNKLLFLLLLLFFFIFLVNHFFLFI